MRSRAGLLAILFFFCGLSALTAASPAGSGGVDVHVHTRDGSPVRGARVWLRPVDAPAWERYRLYSEVSDAGGSAAFGGLAPGRYDVGLAREGSTEFVDPERNPYAPAPRVTLVGSDERVRADLELWRGTRVSLSLQVDRGEIPLQALSFTHRESAARYEGRIDENGNYETVLVPGAWQLAIDPPRGHLLVDVEVDGQSVPGAQPELDMQEFGPTRHVLWKYAAPATIEGRVVVISGDGRPIIEAVLVEPGPWIDAARARGGSKVDRVAGRYVSDTLYEIKVPDGTWEVRARHEDLEESDPPRVELALVPGSVGRADFTVRMRATDGREPLIVTPEPQDQRYVAGAWVEVWSVTQGGQPLERMAAEPLKWRSVQFRNLEAGDYVAVVGHPEYLEGRAAVRGYDPAAKEPQRVSVPMPVGARVAARALDTADRPVSDVELYLERVSLPPALLIEDAAFRRAKLLPSTRSDSSGFVTLLGVYPGTYIARARMLGERAANRFVRIDGHGRDSASVALPGAAPAVYTDPAALKQPVEELEIDIVNGASLSLRVLPAASLRGALVCSDGGPLADSVEARVFAIDTPHVPRRDDPDLRERALLVRDRLALHGVLYDTFTVGPLESGAVQLALRPTGHGLWTWAYGAEPRKLAASFPIQVGPPVELGRIQLDCSPAVELFPRIADALPPPDMRLADLVATVRPKQKDPQAAQRSYVPRMEHEADAVLLRGLETGPAEIEITITHPHFLPQPTQSWTFEVDLTRGQLETFRPEVLAVGGAIRVAADQPFVRVTAAATEPRVANVEKGLAEIPSLTPGTYRVDLCQTATCTKISRTWKEITIQRAQTHQLP